MGGHEGAFEDGTRKANRRGMGIRELNTLKKDYEGDWDDTMLARQQKRKCVADRKSEPNSELNATKKRRIRWVQEEIQMRDDDYEEFLYDLIQNGDDGQDYQDSRWGADNANGRSVDSGNGDGLDGDGVDDDADPQYKVFLENLREFGKSYVLEVVQENGNLEQIMYEEEDEIFYRPNVDTAMKKSPVKEKTEKRTLMGGMKREQVYCLNSSTLSLDREESESPRTLRYAKRKKRRETLEDSEDLPRKKSSGVKKITRVEAPEKKSSKKKKEVHEKAPKGSTKGRPIKRPYLEVPHFAERRAESDLLVLDGDYAMFLNNLKFEDGELIYQSTNGIPATVIFETDVKSSLEAAIEKKPCDGHFTSFKAVDVDTGRCVDLCHKSENLFRKGLMQDLKRPYDQKEYKKLLKEVSLRRPIRHIRDLRNGKTRSYIIEGEFGPSYKQQHIVLGRKLKAAKGDQPKLLSLLRGFFYWLKNVVQEGSFCPWNDPACLKVLPTLDKEQKL